MMISSLPTPMVALESCPEDERQAVVMQQDSVVVTKGKLNPFCDILSQSAEIGGRLHTIKK